MSINQDYVNEEEISEEYVNELKQQLLPLLTRLTGEPATETDDFALESTIYKVLDYINNTNLPKALNMAVVEMTARQLSEYDVGLSSETVQGGVKRIQRGGFSQEFEVVKGSSTNVPRGTQIMADYVKLLNRFRRMRII